MKSNLKVTSFYQTAIYKATGMCVHEIYPLWRTGPMEAKISAEGGQTGGGWTFNFLPRCTFAEEWFCNNASSSVATEPFLKSGKKKSWCFECRDVRLCTVTDSAEPNITYCNRLHVSITYIVCTVQRRNSYWQLNCSQTKHLP